MKLIKGKRPAVWIPLDKDKRKQTRKSKGGRTHCLVEFEGTKEELATAKRLGRPTPRHQAWVNASNLEGHGGV